MLSDFALPGFLILASRVAKVQAVDLGNSGTVLGHINPNVGNNQRGTVLACDSTFYVPDNGTIITCKNVSAETHVSITDIQLLNSGISCNSTAPIPPKTYLCLNSPSPVTNGSVSCLTTYLPLPDDTCGPIQEAFDLDNIMFKFLNPTVNCQSLPLSFPICIMGTLTTNSKMLLGGHPTSNISSFTPASGCLNFATVRSPTACLDISTANHISISTMVKLNTDLNCWGLRQNNTLCIDTNDIVNPTTVASSTFNAAEIDGQYQTTSVAPHADSISFLNQPIYPPTLPPQTSTPPEQASSLTPESINPPAQTTGLPPQTTSPPPLPPPSQTPTPEVTTSPPEAMASPPHTPTPITTTPPPTTVPPPQTSVPPPPPQTPSPTPEITTSPPQTVAPSPPPQTPTPPPSSSTPVPAPLVTTPPQTTELPPPPQTPAPTPPVTTPPPLTTVPPPQTTELPPPPQTPASTPPVTIPTPQTTVPPPQTLAPPPPQTPAPTPDITTSPPQTTAPPPSQTLPPPPPPPSPPIQSPTPAPTSQATTPPPAVAQQPQSGIYQGTSNAAQISNLVSWNWFVGSSTDCDDSITANQYNTGFYAGSDNIPADCGKTGTFTFNGNIVSVTYAWRTTGGPSYHELTPQAFATLVGSGVLVTTSTTVGEFKVAIQDPGRISVTCSGVC